MTAYRDSGLLKMGWRKVWAGKRQKKYPECDGSIQYLDRAADFKVRVDDRLTILHALNIVLK